MKERHSPAPGARKRTSAEYRKETWALLVYGHRMSDKRAAQAVRRWHGFLRESWKRGKPPCWASDHVARYERAGERPLPGGYRRDESKKRSRQHTAHSKKRKKAWSRARTARDAADPKKGDIFESRAGTRWEVTEVVNGKVKVRRIGHRPSGDLYWARSVLRGMKESGREKHELPEVPAGKPEPKQSMFSFLAPDRASRRRSTRVSRKRSS